MLHGDIHSGRDANLGDGVGGGRPRARHAFGTGATHSHALVLGRPEESPPAPTRNEASISPAALGAVPSAVAFSDLAPLVLVNARAAEALAIAAVSVVPITAPLAVAPERSGMQRCISRGC